MAEQVIEGRTVQVTAPLVGPSFLFDENRLSAAQAVTVKCIEQVLYGEGFYLYKDNPPPSARCGCLLLCAEGRSKAALWVTPSCVTAYA